MKIPCKVITDLLPLYYDEVCSNESKIMVEEHLAECDDCKEEYVVLSSDIKIPSIKHDDNQTVKALAHAWKKAKKRTFTKASVITLCAIVGLFFLFFSLFGFTKALGPSMEPTLKDGDLCLFSKVGVNRVQRGDIVWVKVNVGVNIFDDVVRIIGIPGDSIEIKDGVLLINGAVSDLFATEQIRNYDLVNKIVLGENQYFMMGDNQAVSLDSRNNTYGLVAWDAICGRYLFKLF